MTMSSLKRTVDDLKLPFKVRCTDKQELSGSKWSSSCKLLVMPGGRDLPYCQALEGVGNQTIRDFVSSGGSYLGICAGAYYGSASVEFDKDKEMAVVGARELAFFPVTAVGPVFPGFSYSSNAGARAAGIALTQEGQALLRNDIGSTLIFYNGGCYFKESERVDGDVLAAVTLAKYTSHSDSDQPDGMAAASECAAIIGGGVGRGKVLLTGVHFEASPHSLLTHYKNDDHISSLIPSLLTAESQRDELFKTCVQYLL